jgi:integrase
VSTARGSGRRKPNLRSSIYLGRDGKWHGWVTMGIRSDGIPDRRHRTGKTEAEVTRKVRELEGKRDAGKTSRPGRVPTVAQWMRIYLRDIAPLRVDQGTLVSTYRPKAERWIIPRLGKHRLDRLYPEHLYEFYALLRADGLEPNTVVQIHRILSRALTIAVRQERITRNPCTLIDAPQSEEAKAETLTAAEARAFLGLAARRRNGTRWSVALALGLRQNEALGLRWEYVDLDSAVIHVDWQIKRRRYQHGCDDPHACGERLHRYPCREDCPKAKRVSGRKHFCRQPCPPGCSEHDGKCPRFCRPSCTEHAASCPQRIGGWVFVRPKGKRPRQVPIPAQLVSPLRKHLRSQAAEKAAAGDRW